MSPASSDGQEVTHPLGRQMQEGLNGVGWGRGGTATHQQRYAFRILNTRTQFEVTSGMKGEARHFRHTTRISSTTHGTGCYVFVLTSQTLTNT